MSNRPLVNKEVDQNVVHLSILGQDNLTVAGALNKVPLVTSQAISLSSPIFDDANAKAIGMGKDKVEEFAKGLPELKKEPTRFLARTAIQASPQQTAKFQGKAQSN